MERPVSGPRRAIAFLRDNLPRGNTLDDASFRKRHLLLCWILALHVPALFVMGVWLGFNPGHVALEVAFPAACVGLARVARNRRLAAFFVTAGLVYSSSVLVHLSGGTIEAHFHFFILIGLIALYQDWVPFLWDVVFTVVSHGVGSAIGATLIFNHPAAQHHPWTWAVIHGVAVLAACVGQVILWKSTEEEQQRNVRLVADLAAANADRQEAVSELLVNLARRNQSLLNRQLEVISDLEQRERHPDVLEELFRLDHLATRIRRNAESLLVLSGDDPPRRWGNPVPLGDVVRAAAAEVEDYRRVDVFVDDHLDLAGRAVADLAHLIAELIENATTFSPPTSNVRVRSHLAPGDPVSFVLSIEDVGVGMPDEEMRTANIILARSPEVDLRRATMLGFHVVARLAHRYGIRVSLAGTPGGGVTALVSLPAELLSERALSAAPAEGPWGRDDRYQRAAMAWAHAHGRDSMGPAVRERLNRDVAGRVPIEAVVPRPAAVPSATGTPTPAHLASQTRWVPAPIPALPPKPAWWFESQPRSTDGDAPHAAAQSSAPAEAASPPPPLPWETPAPAPDTPPPLPWETPAPAPDTPPPLPWETPGPAPDTPPPLPWETPAPAADTDRPAPPWARPATSVDLPPAPPRPPAPWEIPPPSPAAPTSSPSAAPDAEPVPTKPAWWSVLVDPERLPPPVTSSGSLGQPPILDAPSASPGPARHESDTTPVAPTTGSGASAPTLARRVPGTHLTPALRRGTTPDAAGDEAGPASARDPERVRSMLSRFQASQRAGRAAAHPPGSPQEGR